VQKTLYLLEDVENHVRDLLVTLVCNLPKLNTNMQQQVDSQALLKAKYCPQ